MFFSLCAANVGSVRSIFKCARFIISKNYFPITRPYVKELTNTRNVTRSVHSIRLPLDDITKLSKDTVLYSYEKAKFFKYLGFFGVIQLCFWTYWGLFLYETLRDVRTVPEEKTEQYLAKHPIWRRVNLGEKKFRIIALVSCLSIGIGTLIITFTLPSRIVRHLVLHKGGMGATLTTYGPFGRIRDINVHLRQLSCQNTRQEAKAYLSLKVKGRWLYFLIDSSGNFYNPQLFDYTVGAANAKVFTG